MAGHNKERTDRKLVQVHAPDFSEVDIVHKFAAVF